jgi:hypothetical protein
VCFNGTKKKTKENLLCFYFCVFLVDWQDMMKEVGEIIFEMEENMNIPMRTL